jgi:hypothetical protein
MPRLSVQEFLFLVANAVIGFVVGSAVARSPQFAAFRIPTFVWLVLGMLAFELLAGLALKAHPSTIVSMPLRFAGLIVSFVVCYVTLGVLTAK